MFSISSPISLIIVINVDSFKLNPGSILTCLKAGFGKKPKSNELDSSILLKRNMRIISIL